MAFADYKPLRTKISFGNELQYSGSIRALNVADISRIYAIFEPEIEQIFDTFVVDGEFDVNLIVGNFPGLITLTLRVAPDLITEIIVTASGEDDARETIMSMALADQADVIGGILGITAKAEGGLGKLLGVVISLLQKSGKAKTGA